MFENTKESPRPGDSASGIIEHVGGLKSYKPRQLSFGEIPQIQEPVDLQGWYGLEDAIAIDAKNHRGLFFGNSHGLIYPMLRLAKQLELLSFPIESIINMDEHADVADYSQLTTIHEASWQRYGADHALWRDSYNWQPDRSKASRPKNYTVVLNDDAADMFEKPNDVLSIDMDFFNYLTLNDSEYKKYKANLVRFLKQSRVVCVFSSQGVWTRDKLAKPVFEDVVKTVISKSGINKD